MTSANLKITLIRPKNPAHIGREVVELVTSILRLSPGPDIGYITTPVREGWADNFAREQTGWGSKWAQLANRTQAERSSLGFSPAHPILERTGDYKASWITRTHPRHFEKMHSRGSWSGTRFQGSGNSVTINLGSIDYRVPILSGGMQPPTSSMREQFSLAVKGETGVSMPVGGGTGEIPPRPVTHISDHFTDRIGRAIGFLLTQMAEKVKAAP